MRWNPAQYDLFQSHRATPFFDLTSRIVDSPERGGPRRVVDLGCGPGSLTRTLAERWPAADVVGLDSSADMIDSARTQDGLLANVRFEQADIRDWTPGPDDDVVVTNAALQWIPEHRELLATWLGAMAPGSWFAMQVPGSATNASHRILRALAGEPRWAPQLAAVIRPEETVTDAQGYLRLMLEAGMDAVAWETTYEHQLSGQDPVLEWVRGTALRPLLAALSTDGAAEFEADYAARLRDAYPAGPFGTIYPFRRIFAVGRRAE